MPSNTTGRKVVQLDTGWKFLKSDPHGAEAPGFDDSEWECVRVPHDWAIAGPFDKSNDLQYATIFEDGEKTSTEHSGRTGALPHVGKGCYRKTFTVAAQDKGKRLFVEFDGVMSHARIFLNGEFVGTWPYGYTSFCFEITRHIRFGADNVLAVSVEVKSDASRWYPGAGIYRHVRLVTLNPVHVDHWGVCITTPAISKSEATVRIRTRIQNQSGEPGEIDLTTTILDPTGEQAGNVRTTGNVDGIASMEQTVIVHDPKLWDTTSPQLYRAVSEITVNGTTVDRYETVFGIRSFRFDKDNGFFLNGRRLRLNGVCMHHDLGALGAAVNRRAIQRQWEILTDMGCNALRTSHNPPAPEVLDVCDRMGVLVLDEAFDEWRRAKVSNGYHALFDEWAEKDLRAMIRRDRNHPCVIMWSIGNEIPEQSREDGAEVAQFLVDICHKEDPTRPTTAGFNQSGAAIANGLADVVDVPGWNYKPSRYQEYHDSHPDWPMYGSETESAVSTRDEYYFPVVEKGDAANHSTLQVSSYGLASVPWGYVPDIEFAAQDDHPFMAGEFVWTGFDYLGEPTPYNCEWPSRSSYFGIIDLMGMPKNRFYCYRSKWRPDVETLHILPHWTWEGREGEVTPVHCFTNHDAAELFLNGKSQGVRRKDKNSVYDRYRLRWNDVKYEPGVLKVVALDSNNKPVARAQTRTAGAPAGVELVPDRTTVLADGVDLSFVTVKVTDAQGTVCPLADNLIRFEIKGPGRIAAVDNGDQTSLEPFVAEFRKAFHGLCMVIVGTVDGSAGRITVHASSRGLSRSNVSLTSECPE